METQAIKKKIFNIIAGKWDGPFPESYEEAIQGDNGDGLGCFVRIELEEGIEWDNSNRIKIREDVIHLLRKAQDNLESAISAVEEELYNEDFSELIEKGEQVELHIQLHKCPKCYKKIGRGRIYAGQQVIYCPECKTTSPV